MREERKRAYIVILGSIMSGLGKGIVTASIGRSLKSKGFGVVPLKFDGYLNVDCGTMNPFRHGEVFVLDDGTECDMDLGTYERFLDVDLNNYNNLTGGKIFKLVIEKERKGAYLGSDVQFVPHLTNEIKKWVKKVGSDADADMVLVEVGGTVGDLENSYFIEAMRQFAFEEGNVVFVQLTYIPKLEAVGEPKTKPTQHATRLLLSMGVQPDVIICRTREKLTAEARKKISLFCNVQPEAVVEDLDTGSIYEVPGMLERQGLSEILIKKLKLKAKESDMKKWDVLVERITKPKKNVKVAITGKYTALRDSYVSIREALYHATAHTGVGVELKWIETTDIEEGRENVSIISDCDGIIVPGGYGARGAEGKIECIKHAREKKMPFLGLCYGMQLSVVEFARNVCGMKGANSTEVDEKTPYPVIHLLPEQKWVEQMGATNRLGGREIEIREGTLAHRIYSAKKIRERFRHRWEVNPEYIKRIEEKGFVFSGKAPGGKLMEIAELPRHPFFIGTQFHPEFTSRFEKPSPIFVEFVKACAKE